MISVTRLSRIIDGIYCAADDATHWPVLLEMLAEDLGAGMVVLLAMGGPTPAANVAVHVRGDPDAIALYNGTWGAHDPWIQTGHPSLDQPGAIVDGREVLPDRTLTRTSFYGEFLRSFDLFQAMVATLRADGPVRAGLSLHYPDRGRGELRPYARATLALLVPHLQRSLQISERMAGLALARDSSMDALDHLTVGVVLIGGRGQPLFLNRAARAIADVRDGLLVERHGVRAARRSDDVALQRLIADALQTPCAPGKGGGVLAVSRPSYRRPLNIIVAPLRRHARTIDHMDVTAAIFVSDPDEQLGNPEALLAILHGLTPTEAQVATLLLEGLSVREVAGRFAVSENTVRTHLKRIFAKTDTRSQASLVRVLLAGIARVRSRES